MERRETETEARENQKFWKYWEENQSILVVGDSQNNDPEVKSQFAEKLSLHKRSITPTTLEQVVFEDEGKSPFYKEIYSYKGNSVTKFSIDTSKVKLPIKELGITTKKYMSATKTSEVKKAIKSIDIHEIEELLLNQAKQELQKTEVVLLDIFRRNDGVIAFENSSGTPEIHTVVLYKIEQIADPIEKNKLPESDISKSIYVIDPSNSRFSVHLNQKGLNANFKLSQIYTPNKDVGTGYDTNMFRDCIDVAVKIAFGLKGKNIGQTVSGEQFYESIAVLKVTEEITNNQDINTNLLELDKAEPVRARQASDNIIRTKVNNMQVGMDKYLKVIKEYPANKMPEIKEEFKKSISYKSDNHGQYYAQLNKCYYQEVGINDTNKVTGIFKHFVIDSCPTFNNDDTFLVGQSQEPLDTGHGDRTCDCIVF